MKKTKIIYWISPAFFAAAILGSAIPDILVTPVAVEGFKGLGVPVYLIPLLGTAKLAAVMAIFIPGYPRVSEWAYAGLIFDLLGTAYSVTSIGMPFMALSPMLILLGLGAVSYSYYHRRQKARGRKEIGVLPVGAGFAKA